MYSSYGIVFDWTDQWNLNNECAKNVVIFGADNGLLSHVNDRKNNVLVLGEGQTDGIDEDFRVPEKSFSINFI